MEGVGSDPQVSEYSVKICKLAPVVSEILIDAENSIFQIPEIDHRVARPSGYGIYFYILFSEQEPEFKVQSGNLVSEFVFSRFVVFVLDAAQRQDKDLQYPEEPYLYGIP